MLRPNIALIVTASPLEVGADQAPAILKHAADTLEYIGVNVASATLVSDEATARTIGSTTGGADALCVVAATWSEDYMVQDVLAGIEAPLPVIAWALPGLHTGSLCGTHQLCSVLAELGYTYSFVYGDLDDHAARSRVHAIAQAAAARRAFRGTRVARIGARMKGMAEVAVDEMELRSLLGVRLVERSLEWLTAQAETADNEEAESVWQRARSMAGDVKVPDEHGLTAAKYYLTLRDFVRAEGVSAFTVECYPELMGKVCLPISLLAEEGVVGACEGDVNGAVAMRLLAWLTGKPIHCTDLLADDPNDNTIVFSHCGSGAFCLAPSKTQICLDSCRIMDIGVTCQYPGRTGLVTLVNIVGRRGNYRIGIASGEAVPTELVFPGNPVKVRLDVTTSAFINDIPEMGLGHHWMIGEGDVTAALQEFGRLSGISVLQPGIPMVGGL